jgi:predicted transcriptional regulator
MVKQKTTVYIDSDVLTATKAAALTSKRTESAIIEEALRSYLSSARGEAVKDELRDLLDRVARTSDLDEEAALSMAVDEVHAVRRERRASVVRGG